MDSEKAFLMDFKNRTKACREVLMEAAHRAQDKDMKLAFLIMSAYYKGAEYGLTIAEGEMEESVKVSKEYPEFAKAVMAEIKGAL